MSPEYYEEPLPYIADLATSTAGLYEVQDFIADRLAGIQPATFHHLLPQFPWRALFTTNYDQLIEDTYRSASHALQQCHPIISNDDPLDKVNRDNHQVPLVKLHGCISRKRDKNLPFILSVDQYNDYDTNRDRLFKFLYEIGFENTFVFVGHSLQDPDIRHIIQRIDKNIPEGRPRYYLLKPRVTPTERDFWATKRITALDLTFEDFLTCLDQSITGSERTLTLARPATSHPIQRRFVTAVPVRGDMMSFLTSDVDHICTSLATTDGSPRSFYSGANQGWYPVSQGLDANRTLTRKLLSGVITIADAERSNPVELHVIRGEAGSGKTVLLRRLAWETGTTYDRLALFVNDPATPAFDHLLELHTLTRERIFLFWDNASDNIAPLLKTIRQAKKKRLPITIITCERYSEWNTRCQDLESVVSAKHNLAYLGPHEIEALVTLLETYDCLGPALQGLPHGEIVDRFHNAFDRQILVALHEVTMGESFEDIIEDEYSSLTPDLAKQLYRTICCLNRLRVPVRAGLIARVFGITFTDFAERFFRPLQKVVLTSQREGRDAQYVSRHPEIAEIVFQRAFQTEEDRYHEYVRILQALNISFASDRQSFRGMVRAKNLMEIFKDYQNVRSIYDIALTSIGREPYLLQQIANFERLRSNGSLQTALILLEEAREGAPQDTSILHSLAVVWRDRANREETEEKRQQFRREARALLQELILTEGHTPYIDTVLGELALAHLKDVLNDEDSPDRVIDDAIRETEKILGESKKRFPTEDSLLRLESSLASLISDTERAIRALEQAFSQDSHDSFIASRLSNIYWNRGDTELARATLKKALDARRADHKLNFAYAELLRQTGTSTSQELMYFYRRAFTPGDDNFQAQFWFARYSIEAGDDQGVDKARDIFNRLRDVPIPFDTRIAVRDYYGGSVAPKRVRARLQRRGPFFGFAEVAEFPISAFIHENDLSSETWALLDPGDEFTCHIGFRYTGLVCLNIELL
ncbi:P-loop NTPase [Spiribacter halobius]|uniref:P-loop NTPase n=1 Tax=Sediminicurvatus halobius TaxID=2182432 RepID=UPI001304B9C4|nr:SIR2 family protein [Spiribacter halobius]UEX78761.1 SIR2 family protein [Spiribacter halobius]